MDKKEFFSKKNLLSNVLIAVGVILLLVAGGIYLFNQNNYRKIDEGNERVAEYARLSEDENQPPQVDWAALKAMNPDAVGWLQVPGTIVNYPVFQAQDNEYYLEHAPDLTESIGGSVFLDYENTSPGMVDAQSIVYGHHMRNGSQFKPIADMERQELFDGVHTIWYVTEQASYALSPLFLYYTSADDLNVRQFQFDSPEAFHTYLTGYLNGAVSKRADAEQLIQTVSHVLTLSTCNYYDGYGRTLLVCIPKAEIPGTPEFEEAQRIQQEQAAQAQAPEQAQPQQEGNPEEGEPQPEGEQPAAEENVEE